MAPEIHNFLKWLAFRVPEAAFAEMPIEEALSAFLEGRTIKLIVVQIQPDKHSVEMWIDE